MRFMYSISLYVYHAVLRADPALFPVDQRPSPDPFFYSCILIALYFLIIVLLVLCFQFWRLPLNCFRAGIIFYY